MESNPPIGGDHHGDRTGETTSTTLTRKRDREEDRNPTRIADQSTPHTVPRCCNCTPPRPLGPPNAVCAEKPAAIAGVGIVMPHAATFPTPFFVSMLPPHYPPTPLRH
eukprot:scaffold109998_cov63-Attheya_sp.AAC.4